MAGKFVPLHAHSHYSLLKALPKIPHLVKAAKAEGCEALALTDLDNLYGAIEFYQECEKQEIKPIVGLDATLPDNHRLLLLAKDLQGYKNLLMLVSESHKTDALGTPITPGLLDTYGAGLVAIERKGYAAYFLVVADLLPLPAKIRYYTTIRGSVAGSLVTYLSWALPTSTRLATSSRLSVFKPRAPSAPDIDMDFADNRRDEVIEYTRSKYGAAHVAQIGTFGTMLARGVVRDVARALGYPYGLGDAIAKEIPMGSQGFPMTLERALNENPELAKMYKADAQVREIIDLGKKIEGCARHVGVHAAGVVISPTPLTDYTPLQLDPKGGKLISQYDMYSVEDGGALKV
jgi:DNA polymerase III alpha subunit